MNDKTKLPEQVHRELQRLCKWRTVFAGWQLGTRPDTDPECQAVRDTRELLLIMRVELSALASVLIKKGVIELDDWRVTLLEEIAIQQSALEERFPGFQATDYGLSVDAAKAKETTKGWKP